MIIVTGGAGFIGSALASKLNQEGYKDLIIVDDKAPSSPKERNLDNISYAEYLESDEFLKKIQSNEIDPSNVEGIFHQGACSSTTEMDQNYLKSNNTDYTRILAEWCALNDVYFSYASSAATYGDGEFGYSDDDSLSFKLKPLNPYGLSKLLFDQWAIENKFNEKITGFRYFNVYGPNEYHKNDMRSMVHKGFEQVRDTEKLKLFKSYREEYPDGGQKRDFIYIKDVIDVVFWFFKHPGIKGIYNLGTGKAQTWNDLAKALFSSMNIKENIEYIEMPDSIKNQYQYFTEADLTKLRSVGCDIEFKDLNEGASDYVKNYLLDPNPYL